jgi:hypothetical protein
MHSLIEEYRYPDSIYTNALLYAYPGVMQEYPAGFLKPYGYAPFFRNASKPFLLDRKKAHKLVWDAMHFRMSYTFNMQHSVVKRSFIDSLSKNGPFFQSPYPDFYATNVILLKADTLVIDPKPRVVIGISSKSFGYYYFSNQEKKGVNFLNNLPDTETARRMENIILPGLSDKTSWLISMETIKLNYRAEFLLMVDYSRYRFLQILYVYGRFSRALEQKDPKIGQYRVEFGELESKLTFSEKIIYLTILRIATLITRFIPRDLRGRLIGKILIIIGKTPQLDPQKNDRSYNNIMEVFEQIDPKT